MADRITPKARTFGLRLQSYRKQENVTQQEMAQAVGLTKNYISAIERGVHKCNAATFIIFEREAPTSSSRIVS